MTDTNRIPASQQLRNVAKNELEGKLIPINEYKPISSEYSESHKNAISDGDEKGKGELNTIGNKTDIESRTKLTVMNQYNEDKQYTYPE